MTLESDSTKTTQIRILCCPVKGGKFVQSTLLQFSQLYEYVLDYNIKQWWAFLYGLYSRINWILLSEVEWYSIEQVCQEINDKHVEQS